MLDYENQMFLDILHEDGLMVTAKGLGQENVFFNLLKVYSDPGNLVLVMGVEDSEEEFFRTRLEEDGVKMLPKKITTDYSTTERQSVYLNGGVLFVTTRILVVDLLMDRIPIKLVTGILVYKAHRTMDSCQESFILRLYRQKNKTGFIKAFSSSPISFKSGFCQVNRIMRNLFVRNLYLWPRFHATVMSSLKQCEPDVIELHLEMTQNMLTIQTAVLDLMNFTLQELKRINPSLETEELTVENAISKSFHKILQRELDPIWHQLSWKTKQLVSDLKTLRSVLVYLAQYDCITFYSFVSALRTTENAMRSGGWMILDSAETLFLTAKARVFGSLESVPPTKTKEKEEVDLQFEENPKWLAVSEILEEIREEISKNGKVEAVPSEKVLIITADERTSQQVQDYLVIGAKGLLARMYNKSLGEKYGFIPGAEGNAVANKEPKHKGIGKKSVHANTLTQMPLVATEPAILRVCQSPVTVVQSVQIGYFELYKLLYDLNPRYVIMYDADMAFVRQLEVFQAKQPDHKIRVYFMLYKDSVEEQGYLTTLRREKEAFEFLIKEKSEMVIPEDREGRTEHNQDLIRDSKKASDIILDQQNSVTRRGGGLDPTVGVQQKVIVDMREFRSELPSLIHKRGIDIEPVTLEVGDYILTPDICVERKSISDLVGSLNCGRLYNQATSMTRFYAKPMLLIEFDQNKPFALQGKYYLSRDISSSDITARLQLLTIHFPKLRILWSPSPHATAELFEELKKGRPEPDAAKAAAVSIDFIDDYNVDKYNPAIHDFVSKLPGVTSKNVFALLNRLDNLADLLSMSEGELSELLGSKQNGESLFRSLHEKMQPVDVSEARNKRTKDGKKTGRFKSARRK